MTKSSHVYFIEPVAKPRMTQRDKWAKRPAVVKYWRFKDEVRERGLAVTNGDTLVFHVPMPKSWSKKKKQKMNGEYHQQRPDVDNYCKGLLDAIYDEDSHIADIRIIKRWSEVGAIEVISGA